MSDYESTSHYTDDKDVFVKSKASSNGLVEEVPFWSTNPNVILNANYVFELFPTESMTYNQKLNAITRLIFVITIICFLFTRNMRVLVVFAITLFSIYLIYTHHAKIELKNSKDLEAFGNPALDLLNTGENPPSKEVFYNHIIKKQKIEIGRK